MVSLVEQRDGQVHIPGLPPWFGGPQARKSLSSTSTASFFAAAPLLERPGTVVHISGGVATVPPPGDGLARNGEVWTSPCRESPRRRTPQPAGPVSSGVKADTRCRCAAEHVGGLRPPLGAALTPAAARGRNLANGCGGPCDRPGSGSQRGWGPKQGPHHAPEPPPNHRQRTLHLVPRAGA